MKCFLHHDQDAIGACKSCGKGLCPHCAVDLGKGLACRQRCEAEVGDIVNNYFEWVAKAGTVGREYLPGKKARCLRRRQRITISA